MIYRIFDGYITRDATPEEAARIEQAQREEQEQREEQAQLNTNNGTRVIT